MLSSNRSHHGYTSVPLSLGGGRSSSSFSSLLSLHNRASRILLATAIFLAATCLYFMFVQTSQCTPQIIPITTTSDDIATSKPSSISSSSQSPHSHTPPSPRGIVTIQDMLPFATTPGDSRGEMFSIRPGQTVISGRDSSSQPTIIPDDPYSYELCSFTNVCASSDGLSLFVQNETEYNTLSSLLDECFSPTSTAASKKLSRPPQGMYGVCHCFYKEFQLRLLPFWRKEEQEGTILSSSTTPIDYSLPSRQSQTSSNPLSEINEGHHFSIHKYVRTHHIAHWAQKVILFQSAMMHFDALPQGEDDERQYTISSYNPSTHEHLTPQPYTSSIQPLAGLVLHDMDLPLSDHEEGIFNLSLKAVLWKDARHSGVREWLGSDSENDADSEDGEASIPSKRYNSPSSINTNGNGHALNPFLFAGELDTSMQRAHDFWQRDTARLNSLSSTQHQDAAASSGNAPSLPSLHPSYPVCYSRLTFTRAFGIFSTSAKDTRVFRQEAYEKYEIDSILQSQCPPRRIVMIYRENRRILNWEAVSQVVQEITGKQVERLTINGDSTSEEQIRLFASAGLLLSSHSSQLVNVMFSHPHSAMVEITPEFYNADFAEYAHGMGVKFGYALGGEVKEPLTKGEDLIPVHECIKTLQTCDGDSYCILIQRFNCRSRSHANKNNDFNADLDQVRMVIKKMYQHLNWACGGKW